MGTRIVAGVYAIVILLCVAFGAYALHAQRASSDVLWDVVRGHAENLVEVEQLREANGRRGLQIRAFMLIGDEEARKDSLAASVAFDGYLKALEGKLQDPESQRLLAGVREIDAERGLIAPRVQAAFAGGESRASIAEWAEPFGIAHQRRLDDRLFALEQHERQMFDAEKTRAMRETGDGLRHLEIFAFVGLALVLVLGHVVGVILRLLRRSRRELEDVNSRLLQANRDLDDFGGRVAHDLRNLLAPVSLAAQSLERAADRPETVRDIAGRLGRLSRRSNGLIEALLTFARAGRAAETGASASVSQVVRDALEDLEANARAMGATVSVEIAEDARVACGESLLHTVVVNLVGNAIKFLEGRETREVRITARKAGDSYEIAIADTGPGIPPEARQKLFTPFYRVPGTLAPGTGIGLATVQRILSAHQGTISAESEVAQGSTFTVRLPCAA